MGQSTIEICEVGPRDGLQSEKRHWSVAERIEFIDRLAATGVKRIEAVSFVNPKRVPQMADAEAVMAGVTRAPGVAYAGLALNVRGAERAAAAGVDEIRYVAVASETFSQRNQGSSIEETLAGYDKVAEIAKDAGIRLSSGIAAAFGCPFEGEVPIANLEKIARHFVAAGTGEIWLADTIGSAVPTQISERFAAVRAVTGDDLTLGGHFHNTRNTGYANAAAAVAAGASVLDASVGGIGGCPFAPRATGNIASEDLCFMLRNMGIDTGIDLEALIAVSEWAEGFFDAPLPGLVMKAGLFPEAARGRRACQRRMNGHR